MPRTVLQILIFDLAFWIMLLDAAVVGAVLGSLNALSGTTRAGFWPTFWCGLVCGFVATVLAYLICLGSLPGIPRFAEQVLSLTVGFFPGLLFGAAGSWYYGVKSGRFRVKSDGSKAQFGLRKLFLWQSIAAAVIGTWVLWHRDDLAQCRGWW